MTIFTDKQRHNESWLHSYECGTHLVESYERIARDAFLKADSHLLITQIFFWNAQEKEVSHETICVVNDPVQHVERVRKSVRQHPGTFAAVTIMQSNGGDVAVGETLQVVVEHVDFVCLVGSVADITYEIPGDTSKASLGPWDRRNADSFTRFLQWWAN